MANQTNRDEYYRMKAEQVRKKREKEEQEEQAFFERITSGAWWISFKIMVVICTFMAVATLIDHLVDGPTKSITEKDWKIKSGWTYRGHAVLDVKGYMFTPDYYAWYTHVENSMKLTYSPIFRTAKKLTFETVYNKTEIEEYTQWRSRSTFNWFPWVQIYLMIPFFTFIFKRKNHWFNLARVVSYVFVLPGAVMIYFFTLM
mgnify:CR=1 FL=1